MRAIKEAVTDIPANIRAEIGGVSFSGHMTSALIVDRSLRPITLCLPLSDMRGVPLLDGLKALQDRWKEITGNTYGALGWILKVRWLLAQPGVAERAHSVLFAKDYLRAVLTDTVGMEYTDAGNTGLMDYNTFCWDARAVALSGIPRELLPDIHAPYDNAGPLPQSWADLLGLPHGIPVFYGGADMACGALGSGLHEDDGDIAIA